MSGKANDITSTLNSGSRGTLIKFMSRGDSEMGIEIYEDRPHSGRPAEIVSEELKERFLQYLSSTRYHATERGIATSRRTRTTGCTDSALQLLNSIGSRHFCVCVNPKLEREHMPNSFCIVGKDLTKYSMLELLMNQLMR